MLSAEILRIVTKITFLTSANRNQIAIKTVFLTAAISTRALLWIATTTGFLTNVNLVQIAI